MAKSSTNICRSPSKSSARPAFSPEARENQLIAMAYDLAEQHLRDGTATSQEITHFLKLGSTETRLEKQILEEQKTLITAKTEALKSQKNTEKIYREALRAMQRYQGATPNDDEGEEPNEDI